MSKRDDISATEKLLDLIRKDTSSDNQSLSSRPEKEEDTAPKAISLSMERDIPPANKEGNEDLGGFSCVDDDTTRSDDVGAPGDGITISVQETQETVAEKKKAKKIISMSVFNGLFARSTGVSAGIALHSTGFTAIVASIVKGRPNIIDYKEEQYRRTDKEPAVFPDILETPWLREQIREALHNIIGNKRMPLWYVLPDEYSEIHQVSIPKAAALKNVSNSVFWAAKQQTGFEEEKNVFDYVVGREYLEKNVPKILNLVFLGNRRAVDLLEDFFKSIDYPLTGITSTSIGIQNILQKGWLEPTKGTVSHVHIDEYRSTIDIFVDSVLLFSREINTGVSSFSEYLMEIALDRGILLDEDTARELAFHQDPGSLMKHPAYEEFIVQAKQSINYNLPATGRLVRQLQRTFDFCVTNFSVPRVEKIFINGLPSISQPFILHLSKEMGLDVQGIDLFHPDMTRFSPSLSFPSHAERVHLLYPLGAALSDKEKDQNFLYTTTEKEKTRLVQKTNKVVILSAAVVAACLAATSFGLHYNAAHQKKVFQGLSETFRSLNPAEDNEVLKTSLLVKAGQIKKLEEENLAIANRYAPVALLQDIMKRIPDSIKIVKLELETDRGAVQKGEEGKDATQANSTPRIGMSLEGYIAAGAEQREFILANLLKQLGESPLLGGDLPVRHKKEVNFNERDVLQFKIYAKPADFQSMPASPTGDNNTGGDNKET